ncbi:MAG: dicarboxylate/amino acid:cation symporter, partial [Zetaproteobacteria bacterium]
MNPPTWAGRERRMLWLMLAAIISGGTAGYFWGHAMQSIAWLGELFLTALKMMIVPLVAASIITGVAGLGNVRKLGRMGALSLAYYMSTTLIAVSIGLVMANLWQPGEGVEWKQASAPDIAQAGDIGVSDLILSLVHPNIIAAAADMKLLPLIVFCILFAAALSTLENKAATVIGFFEGVNGAMMVMVEWIMLLAPVG